MADPWLPYGYARISNRILEEIFSRSFTSLQKDVLSVVVRETWGRPSDPEVVVLSAREIAEMVGASTCKTDGAIKALIDGNVLSSPNRGRRKGGPRALSVQPDYRLWLVKRKGKVKMENTYHRVGAGTHPKVGRAPTSGYERHLPLGMTPQHLTPDVEPTSEPPKTLKTLKTKKDNILGPSPSAQGGDYPLRGEEEEKRSKTASGHAKGTKKQAENLIEYYREAYRKTHRCDPIIGSRKVINAKFRAALKEVSEDELADTIWIAVRSDDKFFAGGLASILSPAGIEKARAIRRDEMPYPTAFSNSCLREEATA